jgi:hypothetical protein
LRSPSAPLHVILITLLSTEQKDLISKNRSFATLRMTT